jgi:hypothetical protein
LDTHDGDRDADDNQVCHESSGAEYRHGVLEEVALVHIGDWLPYSKYHGPAAECSDQEKHVSPDYDEPEQSNQQCVDFTVDGKYAPVKQQDARLRTGQC